MTRYFLGIPINGDICHGSRMEQLTLADFQPIFKAVLDDPTVVEFGWTQYTPYFNDGDVCEFSAGNPWFRTEADKSFEEMEESEVSGEDYYDRYVYEEDLAVGWGEHPSLTGNPEHEDSLARCVDLDGAIAGGSFDHVLLDLFGDHCQVTVTKDKIEVDEYYHE